MDRRLGFLAVILVFAASSCAKTPPAGTLDTAGDPPAIEAGRYMVKFKPSPFGDASGVLGLGAQAPLISPFVGASRAQALRAQVGEDTMVEQLSKDLFLIRIPQGSQAAQSVQALQTGDQIEFVEKDSQVFAFHMPNDPGYAQQWSHRNIHSEQAWDVSVGSRGVTVALIDTGADYNHPDLAANIWNNPNPNGAGEGPHGYNFVANNGDPMADDVPHYHGTHCAGIIGALMDNGTGVVGASPLVTIMPLKFIASNGGGNVSDAVRAIYYAISKHVNIMSNSWGGPGASPALATAINDAMNAGILFIAAAGNGNSQGIGQNNDITPTYPAAYTFDNMITVAATDQSDNLTSFSNYGAHTVHVAAPGYNIYSTMNGNQYQLMSGTSMATPLVAGVAANIMARNPSLSWRQVKQILIQSSDPISGLSGKVVANGRINAAKAIQLAGGPGPSPTPTPTPTPSPTPTPTPTPTPPGGYAPGNPPMLGGALSLKVTNPYQQIPITWNESNFPGTQLVYIEVSKANTPFANPRGLNPDPNHLTFGAYNGTTGQLVTVPARDLPGWGVYQIRVIPLVSGSQVTGSFSDPALLTLSPN